MGVSWSTREITKKRLEWRVQCPLTAKDLGQIIGVVSAAVAKMGRSQYDDCFSVEGQDEELVFFVEFEEKLQS